MEILQTNTSEIELLESKIAKTKAHLTDLATMGTVITRIHDIDAVLSVVMDMAIRLISGEVGMIFVDENDQMKMHISWGVNEETIDSIRCQDGETIVTHCHHERKAIIVNEFSERPEIPKNISSVIAVPITTSDKCLGVLVIINKTDESRFTQDDEDVLEMLLNFVAVAIDNSILIKRQLQQQKIEQEMLIAKQIQHTILPIIKNDYKGIDVATIYNPAREVGGDFYDLIKVSDSRFLVIIGDVSSKGVPAALVMSAASGIIKSIVDENPEIIVSQLASKLNELLVEQIIKDREMFVTLFFASIDTKGMELTYTNAGHIPGLFYDASKDDVIELPEGGPLIGQFKNMKFEQGKRSLASNDKLFLFTDGLTEAENAKQELFGRERVMQLLRNENSLGVNEFCQKVKDKIDQYSRGASEESFDDFTIMQVRIK